VDQISDERFASFHGNDLHNFALLQTIYQE